MTKTIENPFPAVRFVDLGDDAVVVDGDRVVKPGIVLDIALFEVDQLICSAIQVERACVVPELEPLLKNPLDQKITT